MRMMRILSAAGVVGSCACNFVNDLGTKDYLITTTIQLKTYNTLTWILLTCLLLVDDNYFKIAVVTIFAEKKRYIRN